MKKIFLVIGFILLCGSLVACGRYSEPSPIEGSGYPHRYPAKN